MTRHRRFFTDPLPETYQEPDPLPETYQEPDPLPETYQEPDPLPETYQEPDPLPETYQEPDPLPETYQEPDPNVTYALQVLQRRLDSGRSRQHRARRRTAEPPPVNLDASSATLRYSGFIIVRLAQHLDLSRADSAETLSHAAKILGLKGLARLLRTHRLGASSSRLVAIEDNGYVQDHPRPSIVDRYQDRPRPNPPTDLRTMEREAATSDLPPLRSLASYWRIDFNGKVTRTKPQDGQVWMNGWEPGPEDEIKSFLRQLNELVEVDRAYRELAVTEPAPDPAGRGDALAGIQQYRQRAPFGIDAAWAYRQGADGSGIGLVDLERGWILAHEELASHQPIDLIVGKNRHEDPSDDFRGDHGTAVLAEIVAGVEKVGDGEPVPKKVGVVGIAPKVASVRVASHYDGDPQAPPNVAHAVSQAMRVMDPGDVLLLEVQRSYLPTEVDDADFDAIRLATSRGIIVVEAAGNGEADLDRYVDDEEKDEGERVLDRRSQDFRESGAIMVGAARADLPHDRFAGPAGVGSNYGSRLDCFAYGNQVVTAGYGTDPSDPETSAYTHSFGGTSGAAPIIAGAALLVQGMHLKECGSRLSPWEMRRLLRSPATGTRQGRGVPGYIGVMPDLRAILKHRLQLVPDLYLRSSIEDTGVVPARRRIGISPDIIVVPGKADAKADAKAQADYGEGSGTENAYEGGAECAPNDEHQIYLRLRNRGSQAAKPVKASIYWSEVATLVTPDHWRKITDKETEILQLARASVPPGNTMVVRKVRWPQAQVAKAIGKVNASLLSDDVKKKQHLCFVAILEDANDHELVLPPFRPPYFDWNVFRAFLGRHNNVAIRNVHRVGAAGGSVELPFVWSGTPDRARTFDFEIVQRLPKGVEVFLTVPAPLVAPLRYRRLLVPQPPTGGLTAELKLPARARYGFAGVRLVAGARFPCRFRVEGKGVSAGHSLSIRQLYRGEEVGRIVWLF